MCICFSSGVHLHSIRTPWQQAPHPNPDASVSTVRSQCAIWRSQPLFLPISSIHQIKSVSMPWLTSSCVSYVKPFSGLLLQLSWGIWSVMVQEGLPDVLPPSFLTPVLAALCRDLNLWFGRVMVINRHKPQKLHHLFWVCYTFYMWIVKPKAIGSSKAMTRCFLTIPFVDAMTSMPSRYKWQQHVPEATQPALA